jgi:hypothetical protein
MNIRHYKHSVEYLSVCNVCKRYLLECVFCYQMYRYIILSVHITDWCYWAVSEQCSVIKLQHIHVYDSAYF